MTWTSSSGDVYRVEHTSVLDEPEWQTVNSYTSTSTRLNVTITNLPPTNRNFYRLISE